MGQVSTVGLDLAKHVFQVHGADASGAVVLRRKLRRGQVLQFFATLPSCTVAMEACAGAHHWGREIGKLGHTVRLIAPAYVKPYVKRQKNDAADAEAICEAAQRPTMLRGRQEWGGAGRRGGVPHPRPAGPPAHPGHQRAARPSRRVRRQRQAGEFANGISRPLDPYTCAATASVSEPASLALIGSSLLGLSVARRRRKAE